MVFGGFGLQPGSNTKAGHKRLADTAVYTVKDGTLVWKRLAAQESEPAPRQYHSCTSFGSVALLFGGRSSPRQAFNDLWWFDVPRGIWMQVDFPGKGPSARYRHAAARYGSFLIIHGGIDAQGNVLNDLWLWNKRTAGWDELSFSEDREDRHSHQLVASSNGTSGVYLHLIGGLDGQLKIPSPTRLEIVPQAGQFKVSRSSQLKLTEPQQRIALLRYGHQAIQVVDGLVIVLGGIIEGRPLFQHEQIALIEINTLSCHSIETLSDARLMVGHAAVQLHSDPATVLIVGGGLTAFSFGSCFDVKPLLLTTETLIPTAKVESYPLAVDLFRSSRPPTVPRLQPNRENWRRALSNLSPVVFERCSLGPCLQKWTPEHLSTECGARRVSIHVSKSSADLSWHDRNFSYAMTSFSEFLDMAFDSDKTVYLRSQSQGGAPRPANLQSDFPEIAQDFQLPEFCRQEVEAGFFSSPLRISSKDMG